MHSQARLRLLHVIANHPLHPQKRTRLLHVIANQCAHWCGNPFSPQRSLASWHYFGQIRGTLSRIRLRHCPPSCPTAGVTDCHVASLLAMTSVNLTRISNSATVCWVQPFPTGNPLALAHTCPPSACPCEPPLAPAEAHPSFACHCEPVRTLVWQSVFPAEKPSKLALLRANSWHTFPYSP